jgi:uncharacterized protein YutE (UPF0331/DUF86 family)
MNVYFFDILSPRYGKIDLDIIEKYLVENLEDFDIFASYVAQYVEKVQK